MYITHRKLNQPSTGRRVLSYRRVHELEYDPNRRFGVERRKIADRRKSNQ